MAIRGRNNKIHAIWASRNNDRKQSKNSPQTKIKTTVKQWFSHIKKETENTKDVKNLHLNFATIFDKGIDHRSRTKRLVKMAWKQNLFCYMGKTNSSFLLKRGVH